MENYWIFYGLLKDLDYWVDRKHGSRNYFVDESFNDYGRYETIFD